MSNGFHIFARVDAESGEDGYVMVRECWGTYAPDWVRTIEVLTHSSDGTEGSVHVTPAELAELTRQLNEYQEWQEALKLDPNAGPPWIAQVAWDCELAPVPLNPNKGEGAKVV